MPSPFPGMNPYLERAGVWHDFHESFLPMLRAQLTPQLSDRYFTEIDQHVYIRLEESDEKPRTARPDIGITDIEQWRSDQGAVAVLEPETITMLEIDRLNESYLRIVDRDDNRLVTVIELLSPTNKMPGDDRTKYIDKRETFLAGGVNLVEIDLLRGWPRMPARDLSTCDYCVVVIRPQLRPKAGVWRISLHDPLPTIHVPITGGQPELTLDLKKALDRAYDEAGYETHIYGFEPEPPLSSQHKEWAAQFIPKTARRK